MPPEWKLAARLVVAAGFVALIVWSVATGQVEE